MRMRRAEGFTLIELLVVVAIVAILAALLYPVFAAAKEHGRQTKCLANLRQLAVGMLRYADDNGGRLPSVGWEAVPEQNWCGCGWPVRPTSTPASDSWVHPSKGQIWPYVRSEGVYICPSDVGRPGRYCPPSYPLSYSMNHYLDRAQVDSGRYRSASKMMLLIHESRGVPNDSYINGINDGIFVPRIGDGRDIPDDVHYTGTTVAYIDGHAKWMSYKALVAQRDAKFWMPL